MNNARHNPDANVPQPITPQGDRGELGKTWTPGDAQGISNRPGDAPLRADADDDDESAAGEDEDEFDEDDEEAAEEEDEDDDDDEEDEGEDEDEE